MGQLFSGGGLTQAQTVSPGGATMSYPSNQDAIRAGMSRLPASPGAMSIAPGAGPNIAAGQAGPQFDPAIVAQSSVGGQAPTPDIAPPIMTPGAGGGPQFSQAPSSAPLVRPKPSFGEAVNDPKGQGLTKGGWLARMLLGGLQGAAAGTGSRTVGEGYARGSGAVQQRQMMPFWMKQQEQDQELRKAQIARANADAARKPLIPLGNQIVRVGDNGQAEVVYSGPDKPMREANPNDQELALRAAQGDVNAQAALDKLHSYDKQAKEQTPSPYLDFRQKYPDTPEGRVQAANDWLSTQARTRSKYRSTSRAEQVADMQAEAEVKAAQIMARPDVAGDPDKAMAVYNNLLPEVAKRDKSAAKLGPFILDSIRGRKRINQPPKGAKTAEQIASELEAMGGSSTE